MNVTRILTRSALVAALLALAACQTPPLRQDAATPAAGTGAAAPASPPRAAEEPPLQNAAEHGAPVAVFLADMVMQEGWRPVRIGTDSTLYLDPRPIVTRGDLTGVQAGSNKQGQGLLALMVNDDAKRRLQDLTSRNPNKRLALVVGSTLMAAPSYMEPVSTGQLIFPVGTEQNATAAARAIAGVDESGAPVAPAGAASTGTMSQ